MTGTSTAAGRILRGAALVLSISLTFAVALVAGLWLHLDLAIARGAVRDITNAVFRSSFDGEVQLGDVEELSLQRIAVRSFTAHAPSGERVLDVQGVVVDGPWLGRLLRAARGEQLVVPPVRLEDVAVDLARDGDVLAIARAFASPKRKPRPPRRKERPSAGVGLVDVRIGRIEASGLASLTGVSLAPVVSGVRGTFAVSSAGMDVHVDGSHLSEPAVAGAPVEADLALHLQTRPGQALRVWGQIDGVVGQLAARARAAYDGGVVAARVHLPSVGAGELSPWAKDVPLAAPVALTAGVFGELPRLRIEAATHLPAMAGAPKGRVAVVGHLTLEGPVEVKAAMVAEHLDARLVGHQRTDVTADMDVRGRLGASPEASALLRVAPSMMEGEPVGPLEGMVRASRSGVEARFRLDEPGAPVDAEIRYHFDRDELSFAARADADLAAVPRLGRALGGRGPTRGAGSFRAEGSYAGGELDVSTRATVEQLAWPAQDLAVGRATVDGRVSGPPSALEVDADVVGGRLSIGEEPIDAFSATLRGPLRSPVVTARATTRGREIAARAQIDTEKRRAENVKVDVTMGTATVSTSVTSVSASDGGVSLDGISVAGLGADITGGLRIHGGEIFGKLRGDAIDLKAVSRVIGLPFLLNGKLDLDVELSPAAGGRQGFVSAKIHDAGYLVIDGVSGELRADFDGRTVTPSAKLELVQQRVRGGATDACGGKIATLELGEAHGEIEGSLLDPGAWREMAGAARVTATDVRLRCVAEVWQQFNPVKKLPFRKLEGILNATAVLYRSSRQRFPSLSDVTATTTSLVYESHPKEGEQAPGLTSDRLDVVVFGALDGATGRADLAVHVVESASDARGDLMRLGVTASLDLPKVLAGGAIAQEAWLDTKLSADLRSRRGKISRWVALPAPAREGFVDVEGELAFEVFAEGTVRAPAIATRARGWGLARSWGLPTDVDVLANYHEGVGRVDGRVLRQGAEVAGLHGEVTIDVDQLLGDGPNGAWKAWLTADLHGLPLEALPQLSKAQISGTVSGHVSLRDLGDKPKMTVQLSSPEIAIGRVKLEDAEVSVMPVAGTETYRVSAKLPTGKRSGLTLDGYGAIAWRDELIPLPDPDRPAGLHVVVERFPLAVAEPFLAGIASRVDGVIDGGLRIRYHDLGAADAAVDVKLDIRAGELTLPGQELTEITANVRSKPSIIEVGDISITSGTGKATGSMTARLRGLVLTDVTATLKAASETPMPIVVNGIPLGAASGTLLGRYERGKPDRAQLSVADLVVHLPASANANAQSLDDHPEISLSHPIAPPPEEEEPRDGRPIVVSIALEAAELRQGTTRIVLSTPQPLEVNTEGNLAGEIAVVDGNLNLLGKVFELDRGVVRLRPEEPDNPYVNVTARWRSPDETVVYIDYVGLVKSLSGKQIRFRSVPPLPQDEILALLLLGGADAGADQAANLTRGIAAAQFNALLGDIAPGLSTSFATTEGYIGTTFIYQLSDSVTARATVERADTSGVTTSADAASSVGGNGAGETARTSVSIDWRFAPRWLLRGTVGVGQQASSSLDVLYQFRY